MIAKGNPHNSGPYLAKYLAASSKGNESAELAELRGFASDNIFEAFALGQLQAKGTQCEKPFFHVQVRMPEDERLTRVQWRQVTERIEGHLGFTGQPRAVVFHQKDGNRHMHLVWSRLSVKDNRAIDPGLYKRKLKEVCRKLEKQMGLQQVRNERAPSEKTQAADRPEFEQSRRLKTDLKSIREAIRDSWDSTINGKTFVRSLEENGLIFAKGDRRSFVIVDAKGGMHALGKKIIGVTVNQAKERLTDINTKALPTVQEAQSIQIERQQKQKRAASMAEQKKEILEKEEEKRQEILSEEEERRQQVLKEEEKRREQVLAEEEKRKEAGKQEEEKRQEAFKAQVKRQVEQARQMKAQEQLLAAYKAELAQRAEQARREEEQRKQAEIRARQLSIKDAGSRYGQALAQHYDIKNPYGSLARSAMAEHGAFLRDRETLDNKISRTSDPKERESLELQKRIEAAEYMAITSDRIAAQSEVIVGRRNTNEAKLQRARAEKFRKEAQELRGQFREKQAEKIQKRDKGGAIGKEEPLETRPRPQVGHEVPEQVRPQTSSQRPKAERQQKSGLVVEERKPGKPRGEPQPLQEFIKGIPESKTTGKLSKNPSELRNNPAARRAHYAQLMAEEQRGAALDRMGEDMKAGRALDAADVRKLNKADRENIQEKGDSYLQKMVEQRERDRGQNLER